jgi:CRP-like cAMP-binding protein
VATIESNSIIGEIAILCDVARTATVKASAPLETLRIKKDQFIRLLAEFPEVAVEIMRVLADRLSRTTAELTEARRELRRHSH